MTPRFRYVALTALLACPAAGVRAQDAVEIVRKSLERDWTDFENRKNYTYLQHTEFRGSGGNRSETNEILILAGWPYEKLIARGGKPLPEKEARKEEEKLDRELARRQREAEGGRSRHESRRRRDREYLRQIPEAFQFRLAGEDNVSGQRAWVIEAEPRPGYRPSADVRSKWLTKLRARIWIEQATYHWVRVDAEALDTLSFALGLVRIARGGSLHFEQVRVNDEIWLPSLIRIRGDGRLALLRKVHAEIDIAYRDYKKFQTDSGIVDIGKISNH